MNRRLLGWLALALLAYYIATAPTDAGTTAKSVLAGAKAIGNGVITFLQSATS